MRHYLASPTPSPASRILAAVLAALALVGAVFFGVVVLALALGLGFMIWLLLTLRVWWLRRRLSAESPPAPPGGASGRPGGARNNNRDVIEADYEVISRSADD